MSDSTFRDIFEKLDEHTAALARIEATLACLPCEKHEAVLDGNGKIGLKERVSVLERWAAEVRDTLRLFRWATVTVILGVLAFVGERLYHLLTTHPGV